MAAAAAVAAAPGPVVWWLRNDLRVADNPVLKAAASEAVLGGRPFAALFVFDPRFFDESPYGRVTDPKFQKSISTRRPINFKNRKCCPLRARFIVQCVRAVAQDLEKLGVKLQVYFGLPEEIMAALPLNSLVICQQEPVSPECTDIEDNIEALLKVNGGALRREWGAMSLYHRDDLPFRFNEGEFPNSFTELGATLGWDDIWSVPTRAAWATRVRDPEAAPTVLPKAPGLALPGLLQATAVLKDEADALRRAKYTAEETKEALQKENPMGGEPAARQLLEEWLAKQFASGDNPQAAVFWDLPVGSGPGAGHDALQWANLARPHGWMRISHYMAVGCISAREIFARAATCPNFNGVAHRLMWRELHRLNAIRYHRRLFWLQGPGRVERPWTSDPKLAEAWKLGKTGVPYVDACMRELRETGWLAYKGRKTAGYFLVFGLGVDWRIGAFHYEDVLLDYDCAMNYGNWVVVACVEKYRRPRWRANATVADLQQAYRSDIEWKLSAEMANDPHGEYIRRWVPELSNVPDEHIHAPWNMTQEEMAQCGCVVGQDYPESLVGAMRLFKEGEQEADAQADDWAERRVHPQDFEGRAYTREEFIAYARGRGRSEREGERLWEDAAPAGEGWQEPRGVRRGKASESGSCLGGVVAACNPLALLRRWRGV